MAFPEYLPVDDDDEVLRPRNRWLQRLVALLLIFVLIFGISYTAIRPWLLQTFGLSAPGFDGILTGVAASGDNCEQVPFVTLETAIVTTRQLCVCGQLFHGEANVDYRLRVQDTSGNRIDQWRFSDQSAGRFCHHLTLDQPLATGRYVVEMIPRRNTQLVAQIRFSVRNSQQAL